VEYRAVAEAPVMASAKNAATASVRVIRWGRVGTLTPEIFMLELLVALWTGALFNLGALLLVVVSGRKRALFFFGKICLHPPAFFCGDPF
jgi:hypothetical protein